MMKIISKFLEDGWNVAYRQMPEGSILIDKDTPFITIPNTWRTWEADPFIFNFNGHIYIFAEMYDYIQRRGAIGYTKWENGSFTQWKKVISESFHMSYPNVFTYNNKVYMLPETSESKKLILYKAVNFPDQWEKDHILEENVMWVDTTFFQYEGSLYAITTDVSNEEAHKDYLLIFDKQLNIVDKQPIREKKIEYSRSGGRFFEYDKKRIRVTQDCSERYGGAIIFSEMDSSTVADIKMGKILQHIFPENIKIAETYKWIGLHTYNATGQFEVIDVERQHFNIFGIIRRILGKVFKWL